MGGRDEWMEVLEFKLPAMSRNSHVGCTGNQEGQTQPGSTACFKLQACTEMVAYTCMQIEPTMQCEEVELICRKM